MLLLDFCAVLQRCCVGLVAHMMVHKALSVGDMQQAEEPDEFFMPQPLSRAASGQLSPHGAAQVQPC